MDRDGILDQQLPLIVFPGGSTLKRNRVEAMGVGEQRSVADAIDHLRPATFSGSEEGLKVPGIDNVVIIQVCNPLAFWRPVLVAAVRPFEISWRT